MQVDLQSLYFQDFCSSFHRKQLRQLPRVESSMPDVQDLDLNHMTPTSRNVTAGLGVVTVIEGVR